VIQLSFQPALDPFHTMFRLLQLSPVLQEAGALPTDHVRILDFYVAFPFRIKDLRVKPEHRRLKTTIMRTDWPIPYGDQPEDRIVLARMAPIQEVALQTLASHTLIDGVQMDRGVIRAVESSLPPTLAARVHDANTRDVELLTLVAVLANDYTLTGSGGLKERSQLLEHRYDAT
jgi:hypothetical protein